MPTVLAPRSDENLVEYAALQVSLDFILHNSWQAPSSSVSVHRASYARNNYNVSFIRIDEGQKVDVVIERPGRPLALIEITFTERVDKSSTAILLRYQRDLPKSEAFVRSLDKRLQ